MVGVRMIAIRKDLVLHKETREGTLFITESSGFKYYPDPNLVW